MNSCFLVSTPQLTRFLVSLLAASRAKLSAVMGLSKIRGQAKSALYPQPEGLMGECMVKYGGELGANSVFGE